MRTEKLRTIVTVTLFPDEAFKTTTGVKIVKRVLKFNNTKVQADRFIYLDANRQFWYHTKRGVVKYCVTTTGYQAITVSGTTFYAYSDFKENAENVIVTNTDLKVNGVYRLRNGIKMKLVATVSGGEFASNETFIGVYKDGTIRFSAKGKLLSHGGDQNWDIVSEWKEVDLWVATSMSGNGQYLNHSFKSEAEAKEFKRKSANVIAINKITV